MVEPRTAKPGFHLGGTADDFFRSNAFDGTTNTAPMNVLEQIGRCKLSMPSQAPRPVWLAPMHGLGANIQGLAYWVALGQGHMPTRLLTQANGADGGM